MSSRRIWKTDRRSLLGQRGKAEGFGDWFPEHRGKQLYGILAAMHIPAALRPRVLEQGL